MKCLHFSLPIVIINYYAKLMHRSLPNVPFICTFLTTVDPKLLHTK